MERMREALAHRGPDGEGLWRDPAGRAVLGHRRLAVLDLSPRAAQPMHDAEGRVLVYNGEIYGFRRLRRELEAAGRAFHSRGDTEVVLAALARWGEEALERLDGMFALALWEPEGRLLLARDRLGIKPLFWAEIPGGLVFASELPALLAHPGVGRRMDREALCRWLRLGYVPGRRTLLAGVRRLEPGTVLAAAPGRIRVRRWYDPLRAVSRRGPASRAEAEEALEEVVGRAVRERLVADVPLGSFLSSGVDSTLVTAFAAAEAPLETLTVRFAGGEDESATARRTAALLGAEPRVEVLDGDAMLEGLAVWPEVAGDPFADPSLAPTMLVSAAARRRWTVALSGDGGDELFSGYPRLRAMPWLERLPGSLRSVARRAPLPPRRWAVKLREALAGERDEAVYATLQGVVPPGMVRDLMGEEGLPDPWPRELVERVRDLPPGTRWRALDLLTFLPERVLAKVDRASMSRSLEVRVPLLDHRVVETVLSLPPGLCAGKSLLRGVLRRRWPQIRLPRRKVGFEVPLAAWLRGPLRRPLERALLDGGLEGIGLHPEPARRALETHLSGRADLAEPLFALWLLVSWAARFRVGCMGPAVS